MQEQIDFSKMTIDELTPIVSMRPGKQYTREQLRDARAAFMKALQSPDENHTEQLFQEASKKETASVEAEKHADACETKQFSTVDFVYQPLENKVEEPREEEPGATETTDEEAEDFLTKAEGSLARILYFLYAYMLVPIVTAASLVVLLASVATAIVAPDTPYLVLHVLFAAVHTVFLSVAWHQFMHRTWVGLILNRALILYLLGNGFFLLMSGKDLLLGIIEAAVSTLFLFFFIGYDNGFVRHN
ncbi:MAG: hypothetical protein PUB07_00655 [Clostridia bacterium]|nr:hypothetical protein [Clostridia bacterium]